MRAISLRDDEARCVKGPSLGERLKPKVSRIIRGLDEANMQINLNEEASFTLIWVAAICAVMIVLLATIYYHIRANETFVKGGYCESFTTRWVKCDILNEANKKLQ